MNEPANVQIRLLVKALEALQLQLVAIITELEKLATS
jgi:hypothetical protein